LKSPAKSGRMVCWALLRYSPPGTTKPLVAREARLRCKTVGGLATLRCGWLRGLERVQSQSRRQAEFLRIQLRANAGGPPALRKRPPRGAQTPRQGRKGAKRDARCTKRLCGLGRHLLRRLVRPGRARLAPPRLVPKQRTKAPEQKGPTWKKRPLDDQKRLRGAWGCSPQAYLGQ
jgi:hypothetical protein